MGNYNNQNQGNKLVLFFGEIETHEFYVGKVIQEMLFLIFDLIGIILTPLFEIGLFILVSIWIINII